MEKRHYLKQRKSKYEANVLVKQKNCSFCGFPIPIGKGHMFIKKDGTILNFCTPKCRKAMLVAKKNPRKTRWTAFYGKQ
jgi:large subunit ribosomal protein L24e